MTSPAAQINTLIARFLNGQSVEDFQRAFMAYHEGFDETALPAAQRDAYWAVHDLVYMAHPHPAAPGAAAGAGLDEAALRDRLRHFHLQEPGGAATR